MKSTQKGLKVFQKGGALNCRTVANILNICSTGGISAITAPSICQPLGEISLKQQHFLPSIKHLPKPQNSFQKSDFKTVF